MWTQTYGSNRFTSEIFGGKVHVKCSKFLSDNQKMWIKIIWLCFCFFCLFKEWHYLCSTNRPNEKMSSEERDLRYAAETIYRNAQRPTIPPSRYDPCMYFKFYSILFNCLIQTKEFMNDVFYCWFSSNSSNTLRFMELCEWRLHCWIHTRWTNVNSAPILPIVCCIWFIFHFNALVHLYHGKRIHFDLIESNLIVSHLLSVWCIIDERRKHC